MQLLHKCDILCFDHEAVGHKTGSARSAGLSGYGSPGIVSYASFGSNFSQRFFKKEDQLNKNEYCEW